MYSSINTSASADYVYDLWFSDETTVNEYPFLFMTRPITVQPKKKTSKWLMKQLRHQGIKTV